MSKKRSKRFKKALEIMKVGPCPLQQALSMLLSYRETASAKFDETVEAVFKLSVDTKKTDQMVRGALSMPNGLGKKFRVAVFTRESRFEEAKAAGAEIVGAEDLIETIKNSKLDFDVCIATPDIMPKLAAIGKILGPRGLMPNPKLGTLTDDISGAVKRVLKGQVEYKADAYGIVHAGIGKLSFSSESLKENILALYEALWSARPVSTKGGIYMQKCYLSVSQGPSMDVLVNSLGSHK